MTVGSMRDTLTRTARRFLSDNMIRAVKDAEQAIHRKLNPVPWNSLRRRDPIARGFGYRRGKSVDRYYVEKFLADNRSDIRGSVLEIASPDYTQHFGGDQVTKSDVLHVVEGNPQATFVGDLTTGEGIPSEAFDCFILTETLSTIYDTKAAIRGAYAALKPGGVLLVTVSGISQISQYDMHRWGDYWRFTSLSVQRLFEEVFPPSHLTINAYGNVTSAVALLLGLVVQDLTTEELDHWDPDYEVTVTARAVKPNPGGDARREPTISNCDNT